MDRGYEGGIGAQNVTRSQLERLVLRRGRGGRHRVVAAIVRATLGHEHNLNLLRSL